MLSGLFTLLAKLCYCFQSFFVLRWHTYDAYELFYLSLFAFFCWSVHTCNRSRHATGMRTAILAQNVSHTCCAWHGRIVSNEQQVPIREAPCDAPGNRPHDSRYKAHDPGARWQLLANTLNALLLKNTVFKSPSRPQITYKSTFSVQPSRLPETASTALFETFQASPVCPSSNSTSKSKAYGASGEMIMTRETQKSCPTAVWSTNNFMRTCLGSRPATSRLNRNQLFKNV